MLLAQGCEQAAIEAISIEIMSLRVASAVFRVAKSTLHDWVVREGVILESPRRTVLTANEIKVICELLIHHAKCGVPLTRKHLRDAFEIFVKTLPLPRRNAEPFKKGRPGLHFVRNFEKRHAGLLNLACSTR
eukprot:IDg5444t1